MNNLDQIESTAKRSKALREAATAKKWKSRPSPMNKGFKCIYFGPSTAEQYNTSALLSADANHIADAHNAALDEVCRSLVKEVRELRAAASVFMRHACRPGDDGRFDDAYDAAKSKLRQLLENPDV